jgi:hypothetical protein
MPGGAVDFHIDDAHIEGLFPGRGYTREKFTYQMSDHFSVWIPGLRQILKHFGSISSFKANVLNTSAGI